jgi:hypothetical protein
MNPTPKGKIGRLPKAIQDEVNRRLENGERSAPLAAWLNSLTEVQTVLTAEFKGKPIREQNLSEWRQHGYKNWLWRQEAQAMAAETMSLQEPGAPPLTDQMATWASVHYLMTVRELAETSAGDESGLKLLRAFCRDIVALRRGEHSSARLKLEQERRKNRDERRHPRKECASHFLSGRES